MRLFLLPISTRRALIYCQHLNELTNTRGGLVNKITNKAAETWAKWEGQEKGWQKKVTEYGHKAMQRIPYEEWGLKSIPALSARRKEEEIKGKGAIELIYPSNVMKEKELPILLKRLGTERQSLHQKRAWWSIAAMPLTIPIAVLPVIPNLPFFYLVYRSWSHFRALNGSKHLVWIVENNLLDPKPSSSLEEVYSKLAHGTPPPFKVSAETPSPTNMDLSEKMLLDDSSHTTLAQTFNIPELAAEVERAVKQVRKAIESQKELSVEKKEIESSAPESQTEKRDPPRR